MADETDQATAAPAPVEPDLEKLRDDKCIPVARGIMVDMATDLIPTDANENIDYRPMMMKIMQRTLDSDLNIIMENPYVFQLILGAMSGLNATVQSCDFAPTDEVRYAAIAKKILAILATANVPLSVPADPKAKPNMTQIDTDFAPVKEQIQKLISDNKLTRMEVQYIMENIFSSFQLVQSGFMNAIADHTKTAEAKAFGLQDFDDLTMKKLDGILTVTDVTQTPEQQ